jgi:hypothetical protein
MHFCVSVGDLIHALLNIDPYRPLIPADVEQSTARVEIRTSEEGTEAIITIPPQPVALQLLERLEQLGPRYHDPL